MSFKLATFAVACTKEVYGLASTKSAFKASMDIDVIEQAKDVYFDWIIQTVNAIEIPDFYQDKNITLRETISISTNVPLMSPSQPMLPKMQSSLDVTSSQANSLVTPSDGGRTFSLPLVTLKMIFKPS